MIYLDFFGGAGGVGRVSRELIPALARVDQEQTTVAGPSYAVDSLHDALAGREELVRFVGLTPPRVSLRRVAFEFALRTDISRGGAFEFLYAELHRHGVESETLPLVNFPQMLRPPSRMSGFAPFIYDLNWRDFPENFSNPQRTDDWCRGWIEQSAVIFTISEFTRREVIEAYGVAPEKVTAAPLAPFAQSGTPSTDDCFLAQHGLVPDGFLLFPSVHGAHKGHEVLCAALEKAAATRPVVVTCGLHIPTPTAARSVQAAALREAMEVQQRAGRLIVLSGLSEADIATLRRNCHAYVLPSRYEGYGFPLAEAVSLGKPAIFSAIPAFLEIAARHPGLLHQSFASGDASILAVALEADAEDVLCWKTAPEATPVWSWDHTADRIVTTLRKNRMSMKTTTSALLSNSVS